MFCLLYHTNKGIHNPNNKESTTLCYSTIFKTMQSSIDKSRQTLGLFNKDWNTFKSNWLIASRKEYNEPIYDRTLSLQGGGFKSGISSLFNSNDINGLKEYDRLIKSGLSPMKAYKASMMGCTEEAKKNAVAMAKGSMTLQEATKNMDTMSLSAKAGKIAIQGLAMAGNMLVFMAISKLITSMYELTQVSKDVAQKAKEISSTFNSTSSSIEDYKSRIDDLYKTINDSGSSVEDVTNARKNLMTVQDELIDKFGDEREAVNLITDAINGQVDALDNLTQSQWQEAQNEFNDSGLINKISNFFGGYSDNIERMVDEYGNYTAKINVGLFQGLSDENAEQYKEFKKVLEEKFGAVALEEEPNFLKISGSATEVYQKLLDIQNLANGLDFNDNSANHLTDLANSAKEISDQYKDMWDQYILYEKVLKNASAEQSYKNIIDAADAYKKAFADGDEEAINTATESFANIMEHATSNIDDSSIIDYFNNMYPDIQAVIDKWEFKTKVIPEIDTSDLQGKTANDIFEMLATDGTQKGETAFNSILEKAIEYGFVVDDSAEEVQKLIDLLVEWKVLQGEIASESSEPEISSFDFSSYKETVDSIRDSISTLRSALDSLNSGELSKIEVIDLMEQFPDLVPYIDLTADGFGNLSEGLSALMEQQPDSLIQSLQTLKQSLATDEEREQVDLLINSLQRLSSYGDTGIEAYSTSIGNTWNDTANVIENVTNQFENLAKVQEAVANGLTMSATAAAELAKMYPEILTNAEVSANGQITLNEDVVNSILNGDKSIIDAQIAKLEADKAELTAKKTYAEAQLNIVKQVAEGEGNITKEVAQYRLSIANELLQRLIEAGMEEDRAYAAVAANMAGNMDEYSRIVGEVAEDTSSNMDAAAVSMANSININSMNMEKSFAEVQKSAWNLADSIEGAGKGERSGNVIKISGGGSTSTGGIKSKKHSGSFDTAITDYTPKNINLKDFQSQLEVDIKGYTDAIANIDSQIAILKNLQTTFDNNGGIGGHGYKDKIKDLEKDKDKINDALDDSKKKSKEAENQFEKTIDFFERRVQVLSDAFTNLEKGMENVFGADAKNALVTAQIGIVDEEINNYTDALAMYRQKANEALSGVSSDLREKIKDGAVQLTDFVGDGNEEVVEAMETYEGWADKVADCTQKLEELKTQIRQLELQKFNNIVEDFTNQFDIHGDAVDLIDKQIGLLEEAGQLIGESFYSKQIEQSERQLNVLEAEKKRLVEQLNEALTSGRVKCCPLL